MAQGEHLVDDCVATCDARRIRRVDVEYVDPHVNEHYDRVTNRIETLEQVALAHYAGRHGLRRKRTGQRDVANPATSEFVQMLPSVAHWLNQIPTAGALHPCYNPDSPTYTTGTPIDTETREWFRNGSDPIGIRSRAAALSRMLAAEVEEPEEERWLSLAGGEAQPIFVALLEVLGASRAVPTVTIADLDRDALARASRRAVDSGIEQRVDTVLLNVLDPFGISPRRLRSHQVGRRQVEDWAESFDVVEAVGILEYLKPEDWSFTYTGVIETRRPLAGAVTFLRNAYKCVRPGGVLIVGNMLDTHPQLTFTLDVVQWPHIQPRSIEEMVSLFDDAGVQGDLDVFLPSDGAYALYLLRKPETQVTASKPQSGETVKESMDQRTAE